METSDHPHSPATLINLQIRGGGAKNNRNLNVARELEELRDAPLGVAR